ncbi:hypothetical protein ACWC5I_20520 [Kitasatospora sp. NPDC001574]
MTDNGPASPHGPDEPTGPGGVGPAPEDLVELVGRGDPLARILLARLDPTRRDVLRRCSVVPDFTRELYHSVLAVDSPVDVADLLDQGLLEHSARPDHYRIVALLRFPCWDDWWTGLPPGGEAPGQLRELAATLAARYSEAGDEPGSLRQLAIAGALESDAFRAAFEAADRRFDLARCHDLVDAVTDPQVAALLPEELGAVVAEARVRVRARALWRPDHHRTAGYYGRARAEQPLRDLLEADGPAVLRIHATGGSGKSMLLRWFMARHCQERPVPVPCAHLDFDRCDPALAVAHPALFLLEAAAQLNEQLPGAPFGELLDEHAADLAALPRNRSPVAAEWLAGRAALGHRGASIRRRFVAVLDEALRRRGTRAVLVLDTLEEVVLRDGGRINDLAEVLSGALAAEGLRIVLSGRYDLADAVPLPAVPMRLQSFDPQEADDYLREVRDVADPELRAAVVESSDGLPYTLALFADLAADLTADQVRASSGPGLLYAIDRVLERVHDDRIRWLLRYGVIPRRLTLRLVQEVMLPHLRRGIRGSNTADDPRLDKREELHIPIFLRAVPGFTDDGGEIPDLWATLSRYAGDAAWVDRDPDDPEGLVLDRTVRHPLRRLLADHEVSRLLDRDLAEHFARRAEAEPERWEQWKLEELYHRFSADPQEGAATWARLVGSERSAGRDHRLSSLAEALVSPELLDEVKVSVVARARALVLLGRNAASATDLTAWERGIARLDEAAGLLAEESHAELAVGVELLSAALLLRLGRLGEAWSRLTRVQRQPGFADRDTAAQLHHLTGCALLAEGQGDRAQESFVQADRLAAPDGGPLSEQSVEAVASLLDSGLVGHAASWLPRFDAGTAPELHLRLLLAVGRFEEVLAVHRGLGSGDRRRTAEWAGRAALRLHRPGLVLAEDGPLEGLSDGGSEPAVTLRGLVLRGEAYAMLRAPGAAMAPLRPALEEGAVTDHERMSALVGTARLLVTGGGSRSEASELVGRVLRLAGPSEHAPAPDVPVPILAELARWPEAAAWQLDRPRSAERSAAPPPDRVVWVLGLLTGVEPARDEELVGELVEALTPLGSPGARLVALERLHELRRPLAVTGPTAARLTELCGPGPRRNSGSDAAALGLTYAELLRVLGRSEEAVDLARACAGELAPAESAVWLRRLDLETDVLGEIGALDAVMLQGLPDALERAYPAAPEAAAVVLTYQTLVALRSGRGDLAGRSVARAWSLLAERDPSLARARCAALLARTAAQAGADPGETGPPAEFAHGLYAELGLSPEQLFDQGDGAPGAGEVDVEWRDHVLVLTADTRFRGLPSVLEIDLLRSTGPGARVSLLRTAVRADDWLRSPDELQSVLSSSAADWVEKTRGFLLDEALDGLLRSEEVRGLRLEVPRYEPTLLAAPWEAALAHLTVPPDGFHLYRGLPGRSGEAAALGRLRTVVQSLRQAAPFDAPPSVPLGRFVESLWAQPRAAVRVGVLAGTREARAQQHTAVREPMAPMAPLSSVYEAEHFARLVAPARSRRFGASASGPQLLHVQGTFRESSGKLNVHWDSRGGSDAAGLGEYLGWRRPPQSVLVLEAVDPGTREEAMRQLVLRNLFAAEVLARGDFAAVVAIGPFLRRPGESERARRRLIHGLLTGRHPAVVVAELTRDQLGVPRPTVALPALFSALPTGLLLPLWTSL